MSSTRPRLSLSLGCRQRNWAWSCSSICCRRRPPGSASKNKECVGKDAWRRASQLKISALGIVRGFVGPLLIIALLFGMGYGAVAWEQSHREYVTLKGVSMNFVNSQGTPNLSNWNMTIKNNGTITFIMGMVCQRTPGANNCNVVAPSFQGYNPYYLKPGQLMWFMLAGINTSRPQWEFHIQIWAWNSNDAPSNQDIVNVESTSIPGTEWMFYNSTSNAFHQ